MEVEQKDRLANALGISKHEQEVLDVSWSHGYECVCRTCLEGWKLCGPDPDTKKFGSFTYEQMGTTREKVYAFLDSMDSDDPFATDKAYKEMFDG